MAASTPVLSPEVILEINKKVIGIVKNGDLGDIYVCILCLAQINSRKVSYNYFVIQSTHFIWHLNSIHTW